RRSGGLVRGYRCEDAETIVVALGSVIGALKETVDALRDGGVRIGVLGIQSYRPFPLAAVRAALAGAERAVVLEKRFCVGQGCGEALGARYAIDAAMRATGNRLIAANATGCLEVFSTPYPESSWQLPWIHSLFGNAAAVGTGIAAALKVRALKAGHAESDV